MRNPFPVLLCACTLAAAGPVGDYLGFRIGRVHSGFYKERDSIRFFLPSSFDSIINISFHDTCTVTGQMLRQGRPAWLTTRVESVQRRTVTVDTAVEYGDSLMRGQFVLRAGPFGAVSLWADMYKVPFVIGKWWRTGVEGRYLMDLNGDGREDTLDVWGDTTTVLDTQTVVVPYDTIRGCYRLRVVARQCLRIIEMGYTVRETGYVRMHQWYKDSMGWVKDSIRFDAVAYARVVVWLKMANMVGEALKVLTGYSQGTDLAEPRPKPATPVFLAARPSLFRRACSVTASPGVDVEILDASGRRVFLLPAGVRGWRPGPDVRPGLYFLRAGREVCRVIRLE